MDVMTYKSAAGSQGAMLSDKSGKLEDIVYAVLAADLSLLAKKKYSSIPEQIENSEKWRLLLGVIALLGSFMGNMKWTWVDFPEPLLISGDDPVLYSVRPNSFSNDFVNVETVSEIGEIYCPVSSRLAIFMSWGRGSDELVAGDNDLAGTLNSLMLEPSLKTQNQCERGWLQPPSFYDLKSNNREVVASLSYSTA